MRALTDTISYITRIDKFGGLFDHFLEDLNTRHLLLVYTPDKICFRKVNLNLSLVLRLFLEWQYFIKLPASHKTYGKCKETAEIVLLFAKLFFAILEILVETLLTSVWFLSKLEKT